MEARRKPFNPFYFLLVIAGVVFTLTACAYGVMTVRDLRATAPPAADEPGGPLLDLLRRRGFEILMAEIGVLAVTTVGAMGTDDYWRRRAVRADQAARTSGSAAPPSSSTSSSQDSS